MRTKHRTLQFRSEKSPSIAPKATIISWYIMCIVAATWLTIFPVTDGEFPGTAGRQVALLACAGIYTVRAAHTLFVLVKRKIPWWEAAWGGSLIGIVLFVFLREGLRTPEPVDVVDALGLALYLMGSYVGTASEYSRHIWKNRPENSGHMYTEGLFRYSRHINYFGDLLVFGGLAFLTRQLWTGIVPLVMGLNFALVIIPAHDAYLAMRYGSEFEEYAKRVPKLVPLLY